jgi:DNA-binding MltR family transcriptional regulator
MPKRSPIQLDKPAAWNEFLLRMQGESDRAAIVLGVAVAHDLLKQSVLKVLGPHVPLRSGAEDALAQGANAPLDSFAMCVHLAHRLGMLHDDVYKDLHRFREMRNECAHGWMAIDFTRSPFRDHATVLRRHLPGTSLEQVLESEQLPAFGAATREAFAVRMILSVYLHALQQLVDGSLPTRAPVRLDGLPLARPGNG